MRKRAWLLGVGIIGLMGAASLLATEGKDKQEAGSASLAEIKDAPARRPEASGSQETKPYLPDVKDTAIYAGKKTSVADLEKLPPVINNNHRQAYAELPGLLVSEMTIPSHMNINYRGLGDPHESAFMLMLKDGLPISNSLFGDPNVYYSPPLESVQRIELIRGGSALLYGPQPGPVVNYVTSQPPRDKELTFSTLHTAGSDGLYSTFSELSGTCWPFGYLGNFHHRQADGPRRNSDYSVDTGDVKLLFHQTEQSRWFFTFSGYESESGEAGRLTATQYAADRDQTTRPHDRIWFERYVPTLGYENELSGDTLLEVKSWGGYVDRFSRRQLAAGTFTNLDDREAFFGGADARVRHYWDGWNNRHTLTGGFTCYSSDNPRSRQRNSDLTATSGADRFSLDNHTLYGAFFAENRFQFGRFAVIPAVRVETIEMQSTENYNVEVTRPLQDVTFSDAVPLVGVGLTYDVTKQDLLYANISQGYQPPRYEDLVNPTSSTQQPSSALGVGETWTYELGIRGTPTPWLFYDTSLFYIDWNNRIETLTFAGGNIERVNSGRAEFYGWEAMIAADVISLFDHWADTQHAKRFGSLSLFGNVSLLEAEFTRGDQNGKVPAYAPEYIVKTGAIWRWQNRAKVALTGVFVADHYWQDSNLAGTVGTDRVPAYMTWDLTAEVRLYKDYVSIIAGINNLLDEDYYSRVRSDGIDPASRRNFYSGIKLTF